MSSGESNRRRLGLTSGLAWLIEAPSYPLDAGAQLARELLELEHLARHGGAPRAWLWSGEQSIVASQSDAQAPLFQAAAAASAQAGWPVHLRSSGGTAVALTPGILNCALLVPWTCRPRLQDGFDLVCKLLIGALANAGVTATTGSVAGAFCDGRHNVLVNSKKFAGISQRLATRGSLGASLIHATMLIDADLQAVTDAVNFFYERAGIARSHRAEALVNLIDCLPTAHARDFRTEWLNKLKEPLRFGGGEAQGFF
jgi:octanoyl-[GcvH]:protein N-octanoyltransferase